MILIALSDTRRLNLDEVLARNIFPEELRVELETAAEKTKKERVGAYALLSFAMKNFFGESLCGHCLIREKNGKPALCTADGSVSRIKFNLTHSDGFAAVIITDEGVEIGIDIEGEVDQGRADRLSLRMEKHLPRIDFSPEKIEFPLVLVSFEASGAICGYEYIQAQRTCSPLCFESRWTLLEAALKCDGGGFSTLSESFSLYEKHRLFSAKIGLEKKLFLSVAIKE